MRIPLPRRRFLSAAASTLALPALIPARALGRDHQAVAPGSRIGVAVIGLGDRGQYILNALAAFPEAQVVAVCDARGEQAAKVHQKTRKASGSTGCLLTRDFREALACPDVDAVFVTAPEHWHAVMSNRAMRAGKDVFCEKALALTVAEGRSVCDTVARTGRVLQAGTQQRSDARFRQACELARQGRLGQLRVITVAVPGGRRVLRLPPAPIPADLDYDLWLGPAPVKPYREKLCAFNWYFLTDYCAGWIQSWGVHHLDIALWGAPELMQAPIQVEGTASFEPAGDADVSFGWDVTFTAPSGLRVRFFDDASSPVGHGVRFEGDKGWAHVTRSSIQAEPAALLEARPAPGEIRLPVSTNHLSNFFDCIRTRREPIAPAEACQAATALSLAADIATRCGRPLVWDWRREQFADNDPANRLLTRSMRQPWHV